MSSSEITLYRKSTTPSTTSPREVPSSIDNPVKLLEFINSVLKPKSKENLVEALRAKKLYGEVFTPISLIEEMFDKLDFYYRRAGAQHDTQNTGKSIFSDPSLKWFDPASGMGNFLIVLYLRLMTGLKEVIPEEKTRKKHILEKMIYMSELNSKNVFVCKEIFDVNNEYNLNLYNGDTLQLNTEEEWGVDKFDVIVGNPPYNKEFNKGGASPLYNKFIEYCITRTRFLNFIIPSRWFSGGKGLDKFRSMMLQRRDIVYIKHIENSRDVFPEVNIAGGVNYFLIDKLYSGLCEFNGCRIEIGKYDILISNPRAYYIIDKISSLASITELYIGRYFNIQTNDKRLKSEQEIPRSGSPEEVLNNSAFIKCYVSKQKGGVKYIHKDHISRDYEFYKVSLPRISTSKLDVIILKPNEVHNDSYISFKVKSIGEAQSLVSYLQCELPLLMISLRKISHDNSRNIFKWLPLPPLDRIWNNELVYEYFGISEQ